MSQCLGKLPIGDQATAERLAGQYTARSHKKGANNRLNGRSYGKGLVYRAYRCNICGKFHLTTKPRRGMS